MKFPAFASLTRSTALRLGLGLAALFLAAIVIAYVAATWLITQDLEGRTKAQIEEEARLYSAIHRRDGEAALASQLNAQIASARSSRALYYYRAGHAGAATGNLDIDVPFEGWRTIGVAEMQSSGGLEADDRYLAFGIAIGDGLLVIAHSTENIDEVLEIISSALIVGLGVGAVVAVGGAVLFARRTEERIGAIAAALDAVAAGDFAQRAPEGGDDDIGRVARSINAMLDELADNVSSLRQVSTDIAHDLKTPIQRLRSTLDALATPERAKDAAAIAEDAINQTDGIVRTFQALLRIAQIEGGGPRAQFHSVDMAELVSAVGDAFAPVVEDAGHSLMVNLEDANDAVLFGDRDLMGQMLSNLLNNAMRHAPPPAAIGLRLSVRAGQIALTVSDDGPGVPAPERERVFRRLYRLERSRTTEGSGLGLSLVRAVVDLHDGEIRLEDNRPGLKVVVRLPTLAAAHP